MKHKRVWSDEQRMAASKRMMEMQAKRKMEREGAGVQMIEPPNAPKVRDPEVQAVLDSMTPERRAKLEMIQAKNLANLAQTREGQEALQRLEARHNGVEKIAEKIQKEELVITQAVPQTLGSGVVIPPRPGSREISIIVHTNGTMVSQYGPCVCGAAKRQWHPICLKERA